MEGSGFSLYFQNPFASQATDQIRYTNTHKMGEMANLFPEYFPYKGKYILKFPKYQSGSDSDYKTGCI